MIKQSTLKTCHHCKNEDVLVKSYEIPDIKCPWCARDLIFKTLNGSLDVIYWNCYCGKEEIEANLNFDVAITSGLKMTGFSVIKDCGNGFLQFKWNDEWEDSGQNFPANWILEFYLSDQSSSQLLCEANETISIEKAKQIVLRYENLLVYI